MPWFLDLWSSANPNWARNQMFKGWKFKFRATPTKFLQPPPQKKKKQAGKRRKCPRLREGNNKLETTTNPLMSTITISFSCWILLIPSLKTCVPDDLLRFCGPLEPSTCLSKCCQQHCVEINPDVLPSLEMYKTHENPVNDGINYQPQLVFSPDFWLPSNGMSRVVQPIWVGTPSHSPTLFPEIESRAWTLVGHANQEYMKCVLISYT